MSETAAAPPPDGTPRLVSVVVPVFDGPALPELAEGINAAFRGRDEDYEIIFVDDGSRDPRTWSTLETLARNDRRVRAVQLTRNFGQQAATLCGFAEARGEIVVTMDDDLQHDPADLPLLLAEAGHDVVIAQLRQTNLPFSRRLASRIKALCEEILIGKPRHLTLSSYRAIRRVVVEAMLAMRSPHPFLPALMFYVTRDIVGVPVRHRPRLSGDSGYTIRKLLRLLSNLIISNSSILLRAAAMAGISFSIVSFAVALWVTYDKLVNGIAVQGWASLFASIFLIGGMLLFSVGILGEYLIRIIESSEDRPTYFIRRRSR